MSDEPMPADILKAAEEVVDAAAEHRDWGFQVDAIRDMAAAAILAERTRCAKIALAEWEYHKTVAARWQKKDAAYSAKLEAKAHAKASIALSIAKVIQRGFDPRLEQEAAKRDLPLTEALAELRSILSPKVLINQGVDNDEPDPEGSGE